MRHHLKGFIAYCLLGAPIFILARTHYGLGVSLVLESGVLWGVSLLVHG